MEIRSVDGDYVPNGCGGFQRVEDTQELLQRVLFKLSARCGGFAPMPELGRNLHLLMQTKPSDREGAAQRYVLEAIADEEGLELDRLELSDGEDGVLQLTVWLTYNGVVYPLTTEVTA